MSRLMVGALFGLGWGLFGCSSDAGGGSSGGSSGGVQGGTAGTAPGGSGGGPHGGTGAGGAQGGDGGSGAQGGSGGLAPGGFRYGANLGNPNSSWGDAQYAELARNAGARSLRVKLPAAHLARWGYGVEVGDLTAYAGLGMREHVGFLIGSETLAQSTAPSGSEDWENEHYIPRNLYEPIWLDDGEVNPANYFASYVYQTVSTYKEWIRIWQVWNEPDWVSDWRVTQTWESEPPLAAHLPRFNGSIFDYVRMLRVAHEVAKRADPSALIATGGIGYPSFLGALLRYTDNPEGGVASSAYPETGGAYVDVLDFHYYPIFGSRSSDAGVDGLIALKEAMQAQLTEASASVLGFNVTETGAPQVRVPGYPEVGGVTYARSYLVKSMVRSQAEGISGVDWFILSNGAPSSEDVFSHMGLYEELRGLSTIDQATYTEVGTAYRTLQQVLGEATFDRAATLLLSLPSSARGYAFSHPEGPRWVLWAITPSDSEEASAEVRLPSAEPLREVAWDGAAVSHTPTGGEVALRVTGSPVYVLAQ